MTFPAQTSIKSLSAGLQKKDFSSLELTKSYLDRIKNLDPKLNSFITVTEELALKQAASADSRLAQGNAQPLTGIPLAHKDIFCTEGLKTSCGSKMLDNFISPYNATVVEKLNQAGMVTLGKTNMDEFAMGSSNETSFYGPVRNPWNLECVPGGSSGGSAAAVAARLTPAATGTDTGGSIRQPAACCGITGIKPTYGAVSRYGMIAFASSLDQGGPMAPSAEDCAWLLEAMSGFDPKDSTSLKRSVPQYSKILDQPIKNKRIGIPKEFFDQNLEPQIAALIHAALKELEQQGAHLVEISLPNIHLSVPTYYIIAPAECSSNLARYDGVRYGHRCDQPRNLEDLYKRSRSEGFGKEVKRRILIGTYVLSAGYYDAYYRKAQQIRTLIAQDFKKAFTQVDAIASATFPGLAFKLGEKLNDPVSMYLSDLYTIGVNLAGLPGLSMPVGFVDKKPVGMQLIANHFEEGQLLNMAHQYQLATKWHQLSPEF
ncbi:MAG: Asp-tRNA(Asn)/Glu-tRNA(Gln) amidotransferase subunit GatA [Gammaproteobacteria bacterium]